MEEELHHQFHRQLSDRHPAHVEAQAVLGRIHQVQDYIDRLLHAYQVAVEHIHQLQAENKQLKLERHLLAVKLAKPHPGKNDGHYHYYITPENPEIEPTER